jgi:hypothetical protein
MRLWPLTSLVAAGLLAACSNDNLLPVASAENLLDTVTMGALRSTSVETPSAFSVFLSGAFRTDVAGNPTPDFLYDIDSVRGPAFYPAEAAGIVPPASTNPGLKRMHVPFDSIKIADQNGYVNDSLVPIDSGAVFEVRSLITCGTGTPYYGKIEITSIDSAAHTVTFLARMNTNCGYRGLEPGIPKH